MNLHVDQWTEKGDKGQNITAGSYHLFFLDSFSHMIEASDALMPNYRVVNGINWTFGHNSDFNTDHKTRNFLLSGSTSQAILNKVDALRNKVLQLDSIQSLSKGFAKKRSFAEAGAELSIDRVLCGDPYHWETRTIKKRKVVRLAINYALSCGNGDEQFFNLAATAIVICDLLAKAGYSVEILGISTVHNLGGYHKECGGVVKLKDATEPLDISRICATGISGMYRKYTFSLWEYFYKSCSGQCWETTKAIINRLEINHMIETKWVQSEQSQIELINNIIKSL